MHFESMLTKDEIKERFGKDWLAMATKDELREVVAEEVDKAVQRYYRLLTTGDPKKAPKAERLNLKTLVDAEEKKS